MLAAPSTTAPPPSFATALRALRRYLPRDGGGDDRPGDFRTHTPQSRNGSSGPIGTMRVGLMVMWLQ